MSKQTKTSIVFAHGLWADGSCFSKLIPALQTEGHEVMAAQHGLDSLASDVAAVKNCLARVSSPAILVGHSYGGTLITHAGTDQRVAGLVYIAALATDADETSQSLQAKFPVTDVFQHIDVTDGAFGSNRAGSPALRETCLTRNRGSCTQRRERRWRTCSTRRSRVPPGGRSRAGTSWPRTTGLSIPLWNASLRSVWALPLSRSRAVMSQCSPTPISYLMSSVWPQLPFKMPKRGILIAC
jgi:pimeloyl-ACP methyl ester carboxylesterase